MAGVILLVASAAGLAWALHKQVLSGTAGTLVTAGLLSGLAMVAVTSWSRAGLVKNDFFNFNRYISLVAVYLLVALAPLLVALARAATTSTSRSWSIEPTLAGLLVIVFVLNLQPLTHYRNTIETWMAQTHALVEDATWSMSIGCPSGKSLDLTARPLGTLDPQITVNLLHELEGLGDLTPPAHPPKPTPIVSPTAWRSAATVCVVRGH